MNNILYMVFVWQENLTKIVNENSRVKFNAILRWNGSFILPPTALKSKSIIANFKKL